MNNWVVIGCFCLISCMPKFKQSHQFYQVQGLLQSQGIHLYNGTAIIINNRSCASLCGPKLNQWIENEIPKHSKDSIIWFYTLNDTNLLTSIKKVDADVVQQIGRTDLHRYGILTAKHAAIRIKKGKIKDIHEFNQTYRYR